MFELAKLNLKIDLWIARRWLNLSRACIALHGLCIAIARQILVVEGACRARVDSIYARVSEQLDASE